MTEVTSVVVAVLCMLGQVAGMPRHGRQCGVDAVPHREGICGDALIRARNNLCFLLYHDYPEHFPEHLRPNKRSVHDVYTYPMDAFVKMDYLGHENNEVEDEREKSGFDGAVAPTEESKLYMSMLPGMKSTLPRPLPSAATRGGAIAAKRAYDELPHVQKRGVVCDCCFNKCRPSVLARYC
ncbi:hypothetical protein V1264_015962 [Littorina saxatilis]